MEDQPTLQGEEGERDIVSIDVESEDAQRAIDGIVATLEDWVDTEDARAVVTVMAKSGVVATLDELVGFPWNEDTREDFYFEVDDARKISELYMFYDGILFQVPPEIGKLKSLQTFNFSGRCRKIPHEISSCPLKEVYLGGVGFTVAFPFPATVELVSLLGCSAESARSILACLPSSSLRIPSCLCHMQLFKCSLNNGDLETILFEMAFPRLSTLSLTKNKITSVRAISERLSRENGGGDMTPPPSINHLRVLDLSDNPIIDSLVESSEPNHEELASMIHVLDTFQRLAKIGYKYDWEAGDIPLMPLIQHRLDVNRAGRFRLTASSDAHPDSKPTPMGVWSPVLARCAHSSLNSTRNNRVNFDGIYYLLRHGPMFAGRTIFERATTSGTHSRDDRAMSSALVERKRLNRPEKKPSRKRLREE